VLFLFSFRYPIHLLFVHFRPQQQQQLLDVMQLQDAVTKYCSRAKFGYTRHRLDVFRDTAALCSLFKPKVVTTSTDDQQRQDPLEKRFHFISAAGMSAVSITLIFLLDNYHAEGGRLVMGFANMFTTTILLLAVYWNNEMTLG
jgi:hypothetical protein